MKIGNPFQRPDKASQMKTTTIRERPRITAAPTDVREVRDAAIHVHLKEIGATIIIEIIIVIGTSETDMPGREARHQADSDGPNAMLKRLSEDKNVMPRE